MINKKIENTIKEKLNVAIRDMCILKFNKGPENIVITFSENSIKCLMYNILSKSERSIIKFTNQKGIDDILNVRTLSFESNKKKCNDVFSEIIGFKVAMSNVYFSKNVEHCSFLILRENLIDVNNYFSLIDIEKKEMFIRNLKNIIIKTSKQILDRGPERIEIELDRNRIYAKMHNNLTKFD